MLIIFQQFFPSTRFYSTYPSHPFHLRILIRPNRSPSLVLWWNLYHVQDIVAHVFQPRTLWERTLQGFYADIPACPPTVQRSIHCTRLVAYTRSIDFFDPMLRPVESPMGYPIFEIIINDYYGIVILLLELK